MRKKKETDSALEWLEEDWENRLVLIDGDLGDEEDDEEDDLPELPAVKAMVEEATARSPLPRRRRRRAPPVMPTPSNQTRERRMAERTVKRRVDKLVSGAVKKALPTIALKLSQEARRIMKRAKGYLLDRSEFEEVVEYLRQTVKTFELAEKVRDGAYFRTMLIAWLTEQGDTETDLKEALSLVAQTETMFDVERDGARLKKLKELKSEIRRRLRELQAAEKRKS